MYLQYPHIHSSSNPRQGRLLLAIVTLLLSLAALIIVQSVAIPTAPVAPDVRLNLSQLPLPFVTNAGQSDSLVHFQVHDGAHTVFFAADEIVLVSPAREKAATSTVHLSFEGANPAATISGIDQLPGIVNYFVGSDPAQWRTNVPVYSGVVYQELYPGIDLRYDGTSGRLKGTYLVAPGADPALIRWRHAGATNVRVDQVTGNLVITLPGTGETEATLVEQAPVAWQNLNGQHVAVSAGYALAEDGTVGFTLGSYDPAQPLTIDPTLIYSTYLGGGGRDDGEGIAVDSSGIYVVGSTSSTNFPTRAPEQDSNGGEDDVFVTKISPTGNEMVYSTYLGGSDNDHGNDIALDSSGNAYITGVTFSTNFPTQNAFQSSCKLLSGFICIGDVFVARLNADGSSLLYSTYVGGDSIDIAEGIAVDSDGAMYITGFTESSNFPTQNPLYGANDSTNVFVTKLNPAGSSLVYSTYLGGTNTDLGLEIAVDSAKKAYVTGETNSANFPVRNAAQGSLAGGGDVFVTRLNASGSDLDYSTYLGGTNDDKVSGIAVSGSSAYIIGSTESRNFPTRNAFQATYGGGTFDAFVSKLSAGGALDYSTYLGGSSDDQGNDIAVDGSGNAYVTGQTASGNFPLQNPLQSVHAGQGDVFVAKLNAGGDALAYGTFLGGSHSDLGDGIALDSENNAYVTGITYSSNFPTRSPLQAAFRGGDFDSFVIKISDAGDQTLPPPPPSGDNLAGSHKVASQAILGPDEELTYTIRLHNSGTGDAIVDVTDEVPDKLEFAGSITGGGSYNAGTRTITWNNVTVSAGDNVVLSFKVRGQTVHVPTPVTNTAVIKPKGEDAFERSFPILLIPIPVTEDVSPPTVDSVTIDDQDVLTDRDVTLHISASDNKVVTRMFIKEWVLTTEIIPRWKQVQSSGWVPFEENYPWRLIAESGTHYVGVWVADAAGHVSRLTKDAIDFASLLQNNESISNGGLVPYLVYYDAGVNVTATLETVSGDADLYVWFPGNYGKPDEKSINSGTELDQVTFTTPTAGKYLFLVHGFRASTYNLSITPGGGPRVEAVTVGENSSAAAQTTAADTVAAKTDPPMILIWSGLDPLGVATPPEGAFTIYLPVVVNN